MKTLQLAIVAIAGITAIGMASFAAIYSSYYEPEALPSQVRQDPRYSGLTDEQIMNMNHAKLGCAKTGNKTACDEMIEEKINYYKELNQNP